MIKEWFFVNVNNSILLYFTLKKSVLLVDSEEYLAAKKYLETGEKDRILYRDLYSAIDSSLKKENSIIDSQLSKKGEIVILLTAACNMRCEYCYSHNSRISENSMNLMAIKRSILKYFQKNTYKCITIRFLGGGEPMLAWKQIVEITKYVTLLANKYEIVVNMGLTTNGTLIDERKLLWLIKNNFEIELSCDILPEIQNKQRPMVSGKNSFDSVNNTLNLLIKNKANFFIRSTITLLAVNRMKEMVEFIANNYSEKIRLKFEAVSDEHSFTKEYCDKFVQNYFSAQEYADSHGIVLKNSIVDSTKKYKSKFCPGEYCINSYGEVTTCHRAAFQNDKFHDVFLSNDATNAVTDNLREECELCFARLHCAGGCKYNQLVYSNEKENLYCSFVRRLIGLKLLKICYARSVMMRI